MKRPILYYVLLLLFFWSSSNAQEKFTAHYIGYRINNTKNSSFKSQELRFVKNTKDTLRMNIKLPYNTVNRQVIDRGVYYRCHFKENTKYTFTLKKICADKLPPALSSYYKTNIIADSKDCSRFTEVEKNTEYQNKGNYGKYVDINGTLFEIVDLSPQDGCLFQR